MGTTLTGTTPQDTYDSLIKVTDNGPLSGTAKYLSDGLGNDSVLALSTSRVGVGTNAPSYDLTLSKSVAAGNVVLQIENTSTTGSARLWFGNNANAAGARIQYFGATHAQRPNLFSIGTDAADDVMFETSGSERIRITSAGNVGIGTSSPTGKLTVSQANSGGVAAILLTEDESTIQGPSANTYLKMGANMTFGAAGVIPIQIATTEVLRVTSNGLTFNGDTAAANALDDYEEGTFTPTIAYSTSGTPTYAAQSGVYTKIGRSVQVQMVLAWNENGAVGDITIQGLPFASVGTYRAIPSILSFGLTGLPTAVSVTGIIFGSSTAISLFLDDNAGTTLTEAYTDNDQDIYVTVTYTV